MRFLCDKSRLESAVAPLLLAIPSKESPKPCLKCIHLEADTDHLFLKGSNTELSIEVKLDSVKVQETGQALIPARPFHSLLRELSDPTVEIEVQDGSLVLPTSTGEFRIVTANPEDFPELDFSTGGEGFEVQIGLLARLFQSTEFACAREATKYAMNGVMIAFKSETVTLVATDGRRLAMNSSPYGASFSEPAESEDQRVLLPQRSFAAAIRAMDDLPGEKVVIGVREGSVSFTLPGRRVSVQQIMGDFPDYEAVIPREADNSVELDRSLFESNLRRSAVLAEELNPAVKITFEGSQAVFESEAAGVGSAKTTMDINLSGSGGTMTFNPNYVFDGLKVAQHDPVRFEFQDSDSPGKFLLGEQFVYIVMPITGV
ncbi:MAG: DNA polymerase III subunit beta [Planctomycetota bacterium]